MNVDPPADIEPLSYGSGLALGLMLILGLPAEKPNARATAAPAGSGHATPSARLAMSAKLPASPSSFPLARR